jgi:general L-amino acid transport system permease protein
MALINDGKLPDLPPPPNTVGVVGWIRSNLISSPANTALTLIAIYLVYTIVPPFLNWTIFEAVWVGTGRDDCIDVQAACWAMIDSKMHRFVYYQYPPEEYWRPDLAMFILAVGIGYLIIPNLPRKSQVALGMLTVYPLVTYFLLAGGFGLTDVPTVRWGGMMVTLVIAIVGIVASLPLGICLALGRRSQMPVIRILCTVFIEFWRGIPLIMVLFIASVMLPLFLPEGVTFDKLLRALIGVALFSSAYMAEVIRGGLQAIPKGQYEAAEALGLRYWQSMRLIILPQALKLVIPGIVNTFIGLFKDTTLVGIIGMFDFLLSITQGVNDPKWSSPTSATTGYAFAAIGFWVFCFAMSRYSMSLERKLETGHKR